MKSVKAVILNFDRREWLIICFLVIAPLTVYFQMWHQEFINLDDDVYVTANKYVQGGFTIEGVIWAFSDVGQVNHWLPATWLTLMADHSLYGLTAGGYKMTNLFLHIVNVLLLFALLKRMTGKLWSSAFVAALFAIHPIHVESVAWVTERKDVLSTLFLLITIWSYLRFVARPGKARYLLTLFAYGLGLMAKPMVITLPFALLLLDFWPLNRLGIAFHDASDKTKAASLGNSGLLKGQLWKLVAEKIPFLLLALGVTFINIVGVRQGRSMVQVDDLDFGARIANALTSYAAYIVKLVWPMNLGVLYPHPLNTLPGWKILSSAVVLVIISSLAVKWYRRRPYVLVGWFWYLGTMFPVIGLLQTGPQAMADRFIYTPSFGLYIMITWGISELLAKMPYRRLILTAASAAILLFALALTWKQVSYWQNNFTLYQHTLEVTRDNITIHTNLGMAYLNNNNPVEAAKHFEAAVRLNPDSKKDQNNLGLAYATVGKLNEAEQHYRKALQLDPGYATAHDNLGSLLSFQGKYTEAIEHFSAALRIRPDFGSAHQNLGDALNKLGRTREAAIHFSKAAELGYADVKTEFNTGSAFLQQGDFQKAAYHFSRVIQLAPDSPDGHNNLGIALAQLGILEEAESHFTKALQLDPNNEKFRKNLEMVQEALNNNR